MVSVRELQQDNQVLLIPRVVIISNDHQQRQVLADLLHKAGFAVQTFETAGNALLTMKSQTPDLIITALFMAEIDGWRLCRLLRSAEFKPFNKIPILAVSPSITGEKSDHIAANIGADALLPYPLDETRFLEQVRELLSGKRVKEPLRLLLVEDYPYIELKNTFETHGYHVDTASNTAQADAYLQSEAYDVVVLDDQLADGTGESLLPVVRAWQPECICLIISAQPTPELALSWLQNGAAAYLHKPFNPDTLLELCTKVHVEHTLLRMREMLTIRSGELLESEKLYRGLLDNTPVYLSTFLPDGTFTYVNNALAEMRGSSPDELAGVSFFNMLTPEDLKVVKRQLAGLAPDHPYETHEQTFLNPDGSRRWQEWTNRGFFDERGVLVYLQSIGADITDRKKIEEELRVSEEKFSRAFHISPDSININRLRDGLYIEINEGFTRLTGYTTEEVIGKTSLELNIWVNPQDRALLVQGLREHGEVSNLEAPFCIKNGEIKICLVSARIIEVNGEACILSIIRDITERKNTEKTLKNLNRELRAIRTCGQTLVRATDEQTLLNDICLIVCEEAGYYMAWVGFAENDEAKTVRPVAWAGNEAGYLANANITWEDTERGRGPTGRTIRNGETTYTQDFETDPLVALWRENALRRGYRSSISMPIKNEDGKTFGAFTIYSSQPNAFTGDEIRLLEELVDDLSFGIITLRARNERKQVEEELERSRQQLLKFASQVPGMLYQFEVRPDGSFCVPFSTDAIRDIFGCSAEDVREDFSPVGKVIHPDDLPLIDENIKKSIKTMEPFRCEYRVLLPGQPVRWVWAQSLPEKLPNGSVVFNGFNTDISERKRAEESLRESETKFRLIFESSGIGISLASLDGDFIKGNPAILNILGYSDEEYSRMSIRDVSYPEDEEKDLSLYQELLDGKRNSYTIEKRNLHKDGHYIWGQLTCSVVRAEDGSPQFTIGMFEDISERKQTEEAIKDGKKRLSLALDAANAGAWEWDLRTNENIWSDELWKVYGLDPDCCRPSYETWRQTIHPEDRAIVEQFVQAAVQSGTDLNTEWRIIGPDDTTRWVMSKGQPIRDEEGKVIRYIGIALDISERKRVEMSLLESEARFRAISEYSHNAIGLIDEKGKIVWVNESFLKIGLYSRERILEASSFIEFLAPESIDFVVQNFTKFANNEPYEHHYSFYFVRSDGQKRLCEKHMTDYDDKSGKRILAISMVDITDYKLAEEEKDKLQQQLLQAQKMETVGRLAGGVAHDFNNLLGVIMGHAEMALANLTPHQAGYHDLQEILKAAKRSAAFTHQLLAFARKQTVSPRVLDLTETVASMLKMLQRLIGEDIELTWHPAPELWHIKMDPSQIDQILANLLVNARDAIPETGTIVIELSNTTFSEADRTRSTWMVPGEYVLLAVSDNGSGMDQETLSHLFEPFFTTKEVGKGTGLGLATVYGIVKQNNGFINVYSEVGKGTTFNIYLPRCLAEIAPISDLPQETVLPKGRETILIVEDEESLLEIAKETLEDLGYTVLGANTASLALRLAEEHAKDIRLLITDVVMPEMDGRKLAEKIHAIHPEIKCLFMSGYTADIIANHGVLDEGVFFIQKPFPLNSLAIKVRKALG